MSSSDRVRYVLLIAFIPFLDNTIIPHIILNIYSSYLIYAILVNGLEFNGFILYGIDQILLSKQPNQSINGLIEYNKIWYENEWQKKYIFIGESSISWYAYDFAECKYAELDNPSGRENEVFSSLEDMVEKILSDALA